MEVYFIIVKLNCVFLCYSEHQLIDWVEHHRMVGVDKMVIYNFTKDNPAMEDHLRHYQKLGVVDVLQWKIPKGG